MYIKQKLITGFLAISLLVGIVGIIGLYANNEVVESFEAGDAHFDTIISAANEVSSFAKRAEGHAMLYITLHNEIDRVKTFQRIASLREQIAILDASVGNPNARIILNDTLSTTNELEFIIESLFTAYDLEMETTGQFKLENHEELIYQLNNAGGSVRKSGIKLTQIELELQNEYNIKAKRKASSLYNIVFIISGFAVFNAVAIGLFIYKNISTPISKLRDLAIDVGKGNLKTKIEITSKDEIGELATAFNKMADDLQKSNDKIISDKDYIDNIVNSMNDSLIVTSLEGIILTVNTATCTLLDYKKEELIGDYIDTVFIAGDKLLIRKSQNSLLNNYVSKNIETIYRSKGQREIPVVFSASIIHDKHGDIQGIVYVAKDLTDRKLNEELERMNELFVGRELRMIELKERIAELEKDNETYKK